MWQCKLFLITKLRGAPCFREHFLGDPKKYCRMCTHPQALAIAKRLLKEEMVKKSMKRQYTKAIIANATHDEDNLNHQINANVMQNSSTKDCAKDSTMPNNVSSKQK